MSDVVRVSADGFAAEVDRMMLQIANSVGDGLAPALRKSCDVGKREVQSHAEVLQDTLGGKYKSSFSRTVKERGRDHAVGEIGSRKYPGLVHLVEKGHAKMGGGRTRAFPHMDPGAKAAFDDFERRVSDLVGDALEGGDGK